MSAEPLTTEELETLRVVERSWPRTGAISRGTFLRLHARSLVNGHGITTRGRRVLAEHEPTATTEEGSTHAD